MSQEWYYIVDGDRRGPVASADLKKLADGGTLKPGDMIWKDGMANWVESKTLKGLFGGDSKSSEQRAAEKPNAEAVDKRPPSRRQEREEEEDRPLRRPVENEDEDDYDDRRPSRGGKARRRSGGMVDYLVFRKMVTPVIIQIVFWVLVGLVVLGGLIFFGLGIISGEGPAILVGLLGLVIGVPLYILGIRIYCEILIVIFRVNDTLTDIKNVLERQDR